MRRIALVLAATLALVVEHARSYGGDAWVEDRPGGGARFVVRFPNSAGGGR